MFPLCTDAKLRSSTQAEVRRIMDPYRVAYEQAMTELNEITRKFDLLRMQKTQVENLINAFRPLIESNDQTANAIAG
jgi:hypothetical protein